MSKDNTRQILERIVGTKSKSELAEKFKMAFAEKYKVKQEEVKQGIVDKVYNKNKAER
jgi:ATP-dependent protease ClpP protease subunit|tara:strand:+ start:67 stop:240 length:174 start_codon:yes stop_codon:yes gene_type:complete